MPYKILDLPASEAQKRLNIIGVEGRCSDRKLFMPEEER